MKFEDYSQKETMDEIRGCLSSMKSDTINTVLITASYQSNFHNHRISEELLTCEKCQIICDLNSK